MTPSCCYVVNDIEAGKILSLKTWTTHVITSAIQNAYFGKHLYEINPGLVETLVRFDTLSWQVFYQYPPFLSRQMNKERKEIIDTLEIFFSKPTAQRSDQNWFIQTLENEYRSIGFSNREIATIMMFTLWG